MTQSPITLHDETTPAWLRSPIIPLDDPTPAEQERIIDESIRKLEAKKRFLAAEVDERMKRLEKVEHSIDELTSLKLEAQEADQDNRYGAPR